MKTSYYVLLACCIVLAFAMPAYEPTGYAVYFRLCLLILISIEIFKIFYGCIFAGQFGATAKNVLTTCMAFYFIFMLLECAFMFFPRSNGAGETLAARLWAAKYYDRAGFNSLGFRDKEPSPADPAIFFVGDSFTEGAGLENPDDRYSDIVGNELTKKGARYSVINIGVGGLDTRWEYETMLRFIASSKIKPKKIVLEYFGNDIENVAAGMGKRFKGFSSYADMPGFLKPVVKGSYLLNYIYWMFPKSYEVPYTEYLFRAYKNKDVFAKHTEDLDLFINYARDNSAELIVVVFPFMDDITASIDMYVTDIAAYFSNRGATVINLAEYIKDMPQKDRVVNQNDSHASRRVNAIVAREILKIL